MIKLALALMLGLGLGYTYGYRQAASGAPSVMKQTMGKFGIFYRVKADEERREQATEAIAR